MTRKDFERLAAALNSTRPKRKDLPGWLVGHNNSLAHMQWHKDVEKIIGVCKHSNSLFDADRFRKAAGVEHG